MMGAQPVSDCGRPKIRLTDRRIPRPSTLKRTAEAVMKLLITGPLLVLLAAAPAPAQPANFVRAFGGVSFLSEPGATFGATLGIRVSNAIHVIGDVGGMTNILPRQIQRDLDSVAEEFGDFFGTPLTIDLTAPGVYAFGGLRVNHPVGRRMSVYAEGGGGAARGTSHIDARAGDADVSPQITAMLRLKHAVTEPLVAIGGGISIPLGDRFSADVGYRFMRVFTDHPRINMATMTAGAAWSF
jgi:hypothetical protein